MITITRKYHFYAAHRNETLDDKCSNIHGHTYEVEVELLMGSKNESGVTMLFSDIDKIVEPIIQWYDHSFIVNLSDPLLGYLEEYQSKTGKHLKFKSLNCPTSVENIARELFVEIRVNFPFLDTNVKLTGVGVMETKSAIVWYRP